MSKQAFLGFLTWAPKFAVLGIGTVGALRANSAEPPRSVIGTPELVCTWVEGPQVSPDGKPV
jgi:hypothetical protein